MWDEIVELIPVGIVLLASVVLGEVLGQLIMQYIANNYLPC
jgi:hypothetical protein